MNYKILPKLVNIIFPFLVIFILPPSLISFAFCIFTKTFHKSILAKDNIPNINRDENKKEIH